MRGSLITFAVCLTISSLTYADSEAPPKPRIFTSNHGGDVMFTMIPLKRDQNFKIVKEPCGVAYKLNEDGSLKELYQTSGWYSYDVHVSRDAKYLVQMGPWSRGHRPEKDDLAVAFHKDGKLLKSYSTADLVKDPEKVISSVSHYTWLASDFGGSLTEEESTKLEPKLDHHNRFTLTTIDGWAYEFDVTNGLIVSSKKIRD